MKHFISVLGTGNYKKCEYYLEDKGSKSYGSRFVQDAVLHFILKEEEKQKISIFITDEAKEKNWEGQKVENENEIPLKTILENNYGENPKYNVDINAVRIETGSNIQEIDDMFVTIYDQIGENDEVYFDITHGLRNIPMLVLSVIEYARVTKNITVGGIYYGAFEVGVKITEELKKVPIFNLTSYMDILNWSKAASSFIKYGNSDEIKDAFNIIKTDANKGKSENSKYINKLYKVVDRLNDVTNCIATCRGREEKNDKESIRKAYGEYKKALHNFNEDEGEAYALLGVLLNKIDESVEMFNCDSNYQIGLATVEWSIKNGMTQQGYTALDETIKTFLCYKAGIADNNEFWRDTIAKNIVKIYGNEYLNNKNGNLDTIKNKWKMHCVKIFENGIEDENIKLERLIDCGYKIIDKMPRSLCDINRAIGERRNNLNHFGFSMSPISYDSFKKDLQEYLDKFKAIIEAWE